MLYNESPKIQAIVDITGQNEVGVEDSFAEWCPNPEETIQIAKLQLDPDIPDQLCAAEALNFKSEQVDFRSWGLVARRQWVSGHSDTP